MTLIGGEGMNLSKFVVLGALDILGEGSGYDIINKLGKMQIDKWTDFKPGSIYFAIKQLKKDDLIQEIRQEQDGAFPVKSIYRITAKGQKSFDKMQEEAFNGLFPYFFGFKIALKFNIRRSNKEIVKFAKQAIKRIDNTLVGMEQYLESVKEDAVQYEYDKFFMRHDVYLYEQEKAWLQEVVERF
jgi:DNA-binding PadR family transcriptional regulator